MKSVIGHIAFPTLLICSLVISSCSSSKRNTSSRRPSKSRTEVSAKPTKEAGASLYTFVSAWEGVPYRYGGMDRGGVDCSGFVNILYKEVYEKQLPRTTKDISSQSKHVAKDHLEEGDLVFFDINGKKSSHVGVYMKDGDFVHASTSKGVIVSNLDNPYYKANFARGGRW